MAKRMRKGGGRKEKRAASGQAGGQSIVLESRTATPHEPARATGPEKLVGGKPALTLALSPRRGDSSGTFWLSEQYRGKSSGWKVQGFKARTSYSSESFHPSPLPFRRGEGGRQTATGPGGILRVSIRLWFLGSAVGKSWPAATREAAPACVRGGEAAISEELSRINLK